MASDLISREELKAKLDRGDTFKLILALSEASWRQQHIPGSVYMDRAEQAEQFSKAEDIVVYCTGEPCTASRWAADLLTSRGFTNVRRYAGGLEDWFNAGLPLEGEMVESQ